MLNKETLSRLDSIQESITRVRKYKDNPKLYLLGKLTEESGEIAKEIVKGIEGKSQGKDMASELGDLFWVINALAIEEGIKLSEIIQILFLKLEERKLL